MAETKSQKAERLAVEKAEAEKLAAESKLQEFQVLSDLKHDGEQYQGGDLINFDPKDKAALRLLGLGVVCEQDA